jgi:hypothetical protein
VFTKGNKNAAQIDNLGAIESQRSHGGPSSRREADDFQVVRTPGEVFKPLLPARMKQRHKFVCKRIAGFDLDVFVVVATLTGEREIVGDGFAAMMFRDDMLDSKRMRRISHLAQAVLATTLCTGDHVATQFGAGAWLSRTLVLTVRCPTAASAQEVTDRVTVRVQPAVSGAQHRTAPSVGSTPAIPDVPTG